MKIIIGLGNPGSQYAATRHNVGFETINKLAFDHNIKVTKLKFKALLGEGQIAGNKVILVKPQTYMNLSGESVRDILHFYKLSAADIIVIYDDTSLPVSDIRIRERGSDGGHNGIKNILYLLGTDEFTRIKIGIGGKPAGWDLSDYVLGRFSNEEEPLIISGITKASEAIEDILKLSAQAAMNKYNKKAKDKEVE